MSLHTGPTFLLSNGGVISYFIKGCAYMWRLCVCRYGIRSALCTRKLPPRSREFSFTYWFIYNSTRIEDCLCALAFFSQMMSTMSLTFQNWLTSINGRVLSLEVIISFQHCNRLLLLNSNLHWNSSTERY